MLLITALQKQEHAVFQLHLGIISCDRKGNWKQLKVKQNKNKQIKTQKTESIT